MATTAATNNFIPLGKAVTAGQSFLAGAPKLSFIFKTNATGGLDNFPEKDTHAYDLIECMAYASGGINLSLINEAMPELESFAIELGRQVIRNKKGEEYFTIFSAAPP